MRELSELINELKAHLEALPVHRCTHCGAEWHGIPDPLCWDCRKGAEAAEERRRKGRKMLEAVDPRHASSTLQSYRCPPGDSDALGQVESWEPGAKGLYIHGDPGGGKTHLAFGLARELIAEETSVVLVEWTQLLRRLKRTYEGRGGEMESDVHRAIERADVVIVDDFAAGKLTDWALEQAWALVHGRYQAGKALMLTTNYSLGDLRLRLGGVEGARIVSRLAEMTTRVHVRAQDYRIGGRHAEP